MNPAETRLLLAALDAALARGQWAAVATVVRVRGSAYRREGARMLVQGDGAQVCMLSGGCLEAEVVEAALEVIGSGEARVVHYDLSEDATWGLGLGCGGSVDVLIERVEGDPLTLGWLAALRSGEPAALCVLLGSEESGQDAGQDAGREKLLLRGGEVLGGFRDSRLHGFALEAARQSLAARDPRAVTLRAPGGEEVFIDVNAPAPELLIYGAGHDAVPLSLQAVALGYRVTVVDPRESYLTPGRFPGARLLSLAPEELMAGLVVSGRTAAVIMNHHLDRDRVCLWHTLNSPAPWIGVLGPRDRFKGLLGALEAEGLCPDPTQLARVRSPVGLALGAEAPEEVALSILAELMAWRRGGSGRPLSGHEGPIHQTYLARSRMAVQAGEGAGTDAADKEAASPEAAPSAP